MVGVPVLVGSTVTVPEVVDVGSTVIVELVDVGVLVELVHMVVEVGIVEVVDVGKMVIVELVQSVVVVTGEHGLTQMTYIGVPSPRRGQSWQGSLTAFSDAQKSSPVSRTRTRWHPGLHEGSGPGRQGRSGSHSAQRALVSGGHWSCGPE